MIIAAFASRSALISSSNDIAPSICTTADNPTSQWLDVVRHARFLKFVEELCKYAACDLARFSLRVVGVSAVLAGRARGLTQPTGETQPPPDQRLPPRETGTELRRTTARPPPLHRQRHALEIERSNPTLELLPTNADQDLPTPSGPTDLKKLSHTFLLRELLQGGRAAWQRWTRRGTHDARQPEGVVILTLSLSGASGRAHSNGCSRRASPWG